MRAWKDERSLEVRNRETRKSGIGKPGNRGIRKSGNQEWGNREIRGKETGDKGVGGPGSLEDADVLGLRTACGGIEGGRNQNLTQRHKRQGRRCRKGALASLSYEPDPSVSGGGGGRRCCKAGVASAPYRRARIVDARYR